MTVKNRKDKIEIFHDALIQHGSLGNRIYLMKLNQADPDLLIPAMEKLAHQKGYTKIFVKVSSHYVDAFLNSGYIEEAKIPGFYHGQDTALFLGRYFDSDRQKENSLEDIENIIELAKTKNKSQNNSDSLLSGAILRQCINHDAKRMSQVYGEVFPTYPFPIDNPDYIVKTMNENIVYYGIEIDHKLVSLSSAEMDIVSKNVEMTDFATLPKYRGNKFAYHLLLRMEKEMKIHGIQMAYTIARAISPGMNITFSKAGYNFGGRLINNTNISGQIESMNVWYKKI